MYKTNPISDKQQYEKEQHNLQELARLQSLFSYITVERRNTLFIGSTFIRFQYVNNAFSCRPCLRPDFGTDPYLIHVPYQRVVYRQRTWLHLCDIATHHSSTQAHVYYNMSTTEQVFTNNTISFTYK